MNRSLHLIVVALVLACLPASVHATLTEVTISPTTGLDYHTFNGNKHQIGISRSPGPGVVEMFVIEGINGNTIESILVSNLGDATSEIRLLIRNAVGNQGGIATVEEVRRVGGSGRVAIGQLTINGHLGRPGANPRTEVKVQRIDSAIVGNNLEARVFMEPSAAGTASIGSIRVFGNLFGYVVNLSGSIGEVVVDGDLRGTPADPAVIRASDTIGYIRTTNFTDAIIGVSPNYSFTDSVGLVEIVNDARATARFAEDPDNVELGMFANSFGHISIGGDLSCVIGLGGSFPNDPNLLTIDIGGSFLESADSMGRVLSAISVPTGGQKTQVIINSANNSGAVWGGLYTIGGIPLTPKPNYDRHPDDPGFGGGAVGLVPFHRHAKACVPSESSYGELIVLDPVDAPSNTRPIYIRYYGPVTWSNPDGPFIITQQPAAGGPITDITACFEQKRDMNNHTIIQLELTGSGVEFHRGYRYSIALRTFTNGLGQEEPYLRCELPSGLNPPVFNDGPMNIMICSESLPTSAIGDANDNGTVDFADINNVLANWLSTACFTLGDANRDAAVNFADITAVLTNFNATYCEGLLGSGRASAGGFAAMDLAEEAPHAAQMALVDAVRLLGYASVEDFLGVLWQLDEETMNAELRRLGEVIDGTP